MLKKLLPATFFTLLISNILFAQIELVHTFDGNAKFLPAQINYIEYYGNLGLFIVEDFDNNKISYFNKNYTLVKEIIIPVPDGYEIFTVSYSTKDIFNTDDNIEFVVSYTTSDYSYNSIIYNENLEIIKDFGISPYYYPPILLIVDNNVFLSVQKYDSDSESTSTSIYSLPGSTLSNKEAIISNKKTLPYPNPSRNVITIPYNLKNSEGVLKVFAMDGRLVKFTKVSGKTNETTLDISGLKSGIYSYEVDGYKSKFIVN